MPAVVGLKNVWTQQPQVPVEIDWSNPITRGLVLAQNGLHDIMAGSSVTLVNGKSTSVSQYGVGVSSNSVGTSYAEVKSQARPNAQDITAFVLTTVNLPNNEWPFCICCKVAGSLGFNFGLNNDAGLPYSFGIYRGGVAHQQSFSAANTLIQGTTVALAGTATGTASSGITLYKNGAKVAINASTDANGSSLYDSSDVSWSVGGGPGYPRAAMGAIALSLVFDRALSDAEIKALSDNPWQIFRPLTKQIWVPA